jgi:hypothetical protein
MHRKKASATSAGRPQTDHLLESDVSRRHALISIGKYAAYVTPAMTVLIRGSTALANHSCNGGTDGQGHAHSCVP